MQLNRKTIQGELDAFENYIERGSAMREFLWPFLAQTRELAEGVFGGQNSIEDGEVERICSNLDGIVSKLHESGCEEGVIIHIQAVRAGVWFLLNNPKRSPQVPCNYSGIEQFGGLIPFDIQSEFEKYDKFNPEIITSRWCQWALEQLGYSSFIEVPMNSSARLLIFKEHYLKVGSLFTNLVSKKFLDDLGIKNVALKKSDAKRILDQVHHGSDFKTVTLKVAQSISAKPKEEVCPPVPPELQAEFDQHEGFCLEIITPRWCRWVLDQLGEESFETGKISQKEKAFVFPGHYVGLITFFQRRFYNFIHMKFKPAYLKDILSLVHAGKNIKEAINYIAQVALKTEEESKEKLPVVSIPPELQAEFDQHEGFCLEVITPRWCRWVLDQLGEESFESVGTAEKTQILVFPAYYSTPQALLMKLKREIDKTSLVGSNKDVTEGDIRLVLQRVCDGEGLELSVKNFICGKQNAQRALMEIPIPPELQAEFDQHEGFCLEVITPRWCRWVLDQLGEESFEFVISQKGDIDFIYFPERVLKLHGLLGRVYRLLQASCLVPSDLRLSLQDIQAILKCVDGGLNLTISTENIVQHRLSIKTAKAELIPPFIPPELQVEFDRHEGFCLEVITPRWCRWVLDQLGEESFESLGTAATGNTMVAPDYFLKPQGLFVNIAKKIKKANWFNSNIEFTPFCVIGILHHVHQGQPLQEAVATIVAELEQEAATQRQAVVEKKECQELEQELKNLFANIPEEETPHAKEIAKLTTLFGGSNFIEVLFLYHPEYRRIGNESVKGLIGEYLGDYLSNVPGSFNFDDPKDLPDTTPPHLETVLFEVLKNDVLAYCNAQKRKGSELSELDMVIEYLASKEEILDTRSYLKRVKERALGYYSSLFSDLQKPDAMVESLREGRSFPDLNQRVNIMELSLHKQLLIADEMGLGKSNSAISAKEFLKLGRAIVVIPASVIPTWQHYLSDEVGADNAQIGYFKPGKAPKVLVVESIFDLQRDDFDSYDYVLISQEKLTDEYTKALLEADYDYLIVDEVHKLKNLLGGKRANNLVHLAQQVKSRDGHLALLSGTPIPNKVKDAAIVLRLLYPQRFAEMNDGDLVHRIIAGDLLELKTDLHMRMQMKELASSIELPERTDHEIPIEFSGMEADLYEALLEEDELSFGEKIDLLRRFCLSHQSMEVVPNMPSTKSMALNGLLAEVANSGGKAVVFVNDFVTGIIRRDEAGVAAILDNLSLPPEVEVCVLDGSTPRSDRPAIQRRLNEGDKPMVLFVSGKTSDVGVSYVGATHVIHLNEPWTTFDKNQQIARTYRPGLDHPVTTATILTTNSFEQAQHEYMEMKYRAILKVIRQIPLSEMEANLLREEAKGSEVPELNPTLAREYLSKVQRFNRMVGALKQVGESGFRRFLETHAETYADAYRALGTRSYQGNNTRTTASLISGMASERGQKVDSLKILDIASGPKTLKSRSPQNLSSGVMSLDLNPRHFDGMEGDDAIIGSFLDIPVASGSLDYCNMGLAFHYTRLSRREENYERIQVLAEMNRVLKVGGCAIISSMYGLGIRDMSLFEQASDAIGFKIVPKYTGEACSGVNYSANYFTLEKVRNIECSGDKVDMEAILPRFENGLLRGLKFRENKKKRLKKQGLMIDRFSLNGESYSIEFNDEDQRVRDEEGSIYNHVNTLVDRYGNIKNIPVHELEEFSLIRYRISEGKYRLCKRLTTASGMIVI